jgi:hypothetical protein
VTPHGGRSWRKSACESSASRRRRCRLDPAESARIGATRGQPVRTLAHSGGQARTRKPCTTTDLRWSRRFFSGIDTKRSLVQTQYRPPEFQQVTGPVGGGASRCGPV